MLSKYYQGNSELTIKEENGKSQMPCKGIRIFADKSSKTYHFNSPSLDRDLKKKISALYLLGRSSCSLLMKGPFVFFSFDLIFEDN